MLVPVVRQSLPLQHCQSRLAEYVFSFEVSIFSTQALSFAKGQIAMDLSFSKSVLSHYTATL